MNLTKKLILSLFCLVFSSQATTFSDYRKLLMGGVVFNTVVGTPCIMQCSKLRFPALYALTSISTLNYLFINLAYSHKEIPFSKK